MGRSKKNILIPEDVAKEIYQLLAHKIDFNNGDEFSFINKQIDLLRADFSSLDEGEDILILKKELKEVLSKSFDNSVAKIKNKLKVHCLTYDDITVLQNRHVRIESLFQKGLLDFDHAEKERMKIINAYIYIINNIEEEELRPNWKDL